MKRLISSVAIVSILFLTVSSINAQVRKIVLIEEATNASCPPCAANNPKLQSFFENHFGGVISVRYHAWWPGVDPMYSLNTTDARARINYYGINGVPNYLMNGTDHGVPGSPGDMVNFMKDELSETSPIAILINSHQANDSLYAEIKIIAVGALAGTDMKLRTSVIERRIEYASAPGSNGEKVFEDVMRKMLPDPTGESISNMNSGDTLTFSFSCELNSAWNKNNLAVVSWIQDDSNKKVIQANIDMQTYVLKSLSPTTNLVENNKSYSSEFSLVNTNSDSLYLLLYPEIVEMPDDWSAVINFNNQDYTETEVVVAPGDSVNFALNVTSGLMEGNADINVKVVNKNDSLNYSYSGKFVGIYKMGEVLIVDDDGAGYETYYKSMLKNLELPYTIISQEYLNSVLQNSAALDYSTVIWNIGWNFPTLTDQDVNFLKGFLDGGGNLLIAAQDLGWDLFDNPDNQNFISGKDFYNNYLGAKYENDDSGISFLESVENNPVWDGGSFALGTIYTSYPEVLSVSRTTSFPILKYKDSEKIGAVANEEAGFKTVYLGFGMEQIVATMIRAELFRGIFEWFGLVPTDVEKEELIPLQLALNQNYPNPFNPATTITYSIPYTGNTIGSNNNVSLKIYDLLGREVLTLVNEIQSAGIHKIKFDAGNFSSGNYFLRLSFNNQTITRKMTLLK